MTVYADILFLINFSMDVLSLWLTSKVLSRPLKVGRTLLSSSLGGLAATLFTVLLPDCVGVISVVAGFGIALVMTATVFGGTTGKPTRKRAVSLLRDAVVLWGIGVLLGGVVSFLLSLGEPVFFEKSKTASFVSLFFVCFCLTAAVVRMTSHRRHGREAEVVFSYQKREYRFRALADSGNLAREPISGLPVVIVSPSVLLLSESETERVVLLHSVGGTAVLYGIIPEHMTVDGKERRAVIAVDRERRSYGECDGIVPASLCG